MFDDLNLAYHLILQKLENWLESIIGMLPNAISSVLVVILFYFLAKYGRRILFRSIERFSDKPTLNRFFSNVFYGLILLLGTFIALEILSLEKTVTSLLAGAGIVGLALGFAFQDIAANFISGVFMAFQSPFQVGDIVETGNYSGVVENIDLRLSVIRTFQGQLVHIPNKEIFQNPMINFSELGKRRIDLEVGISYGDSLERVEEITIKAIESLDFVRKQEKVELFYQAFGDSSINFIIVCWINFVKELDYLRAQSAMIKAIKKAYDENDITIPFPIRTLDFGIKGGEKISEMPLHIQMRKGQT